jgi:hypothetical protein
MSTEERLASLFAEIQREIQKNPDFAERIATALNGDKPGDASRPHRRPPGVLDPFEIFREGEEALKARLEALDIEQLKDIVAEHGMDRARLAMKWKAKDRLIGLIVSTVASRARKGDAFRDSRKPL